MGNKKYKSIKQIQDVKLKRSWYKQAFLMNYMYPIVKPLHDLANPSEYIKILKSGTNDASAVNRLTISPEVMTFFEGAPVDYSQLVPRIEIYKIYIKNRKKVFEVLFPFNAYTNFQEEWLASEVFNSPFRGRDAGIESMNITMTGKGRNPVEAKIIEVTVKYVFNDVKTLFKEWKQGKGGDSFKVSFADLIKHPASLKGDDVDPNSAPAAHRIRMSVGWNVNMKNPLFADTKAGKRFAAAAQTSTMNFTGDLETYDMDFQEDGSVSVTAKYRGAFMTAFASPSADIMNNYNIDDTNINTLKTRLAALDSSWADAGKAVAGSRTERVAFLSKLKKAVRRLEASRKKVNDLIKSGKGDESTFAPVDNQLIKDWQTVEAVIEEGRMRDLQSAVAKDLYAAASKKPPDQNKVEFRSEVFGSMAQTIGAAISKEGAAIQKTIDAEKENLRRAKGLIKGNIAALESSIRAKHLFAHVQNLMDNNKVGWILTDGQSAFESWTKYRDELEEISDAQDEDDERRVVFRSGDAQEIQDKLASGATPPTGEVDSKKVSDKVTSALTPQTETTKIPLPDGTCALVKKHKKIGNVSRLFLSDEYAKGEKIMFFTFGDLISTILDYGKFGDSIAASSPDFRIVFGNMTIQPVGRSAPMTVNLYFLPISLEIFVNFLAEKIVGGKKKTYPLMMFLNDLIKFIMDKISKPIGSGADASLLVNINPSRGFNLETISLNMPKSFLKSSIKNGHHTNAVIDISPGHTAKHSVATKLAFNKMSNVFLIQPSAPHPFQERLDVDLAANPVLDKEEGIPHFIVGGENRGILKSIKFTNEIKPMMATSVMRQATGDSDNSRRSEASLVPARFMCELALVGNPYFYIGHLFYVNTEIISGGQFRKHDVMNGGYYIATSVDTSIASGRWETIVKGQLMFSDAEIRRGKKQGKKNKPVKKKQELTATEKAQLEEKKQLAELQTSDAISGTPKAQQPKCA